MNIENIIEYKVYIVIIAFASLFALEHFKPAAKEPESGIKRIIKNVLFWPINICYSSNNISNPMLRLFAAAQVYLHDLTSRVLNKLSSALLPFNDAVH